MPHQVTHHGQNTGIGLLRILQMNPIYRQYISTAK